MNYPMTLTEKEIKTIVSRYQDLASQPLNDYTLFRVKSKDVALTIYKTGKMLIQGRLAESVYLELCLLLGRTPLIKKEIMREEVSSLGENIIGSDEVGCGDYFGGIVVTAAVVAKEMLLDAKKMGIKDSKKLNDEKICEIANILTNKIKYETIILKPDKYNILNKRGMNLNQIKAIMHNKAITGLIAKHPDLKYDAVVVDGFCTQDKYLAYLNVPKTDYKNLNVIAKAEDKYLSVAAASIIARSSFLKHIQEIEKDTGYILPLGCGEKIDKAIAKIIKEQGFTYLHKIAKINFKNTERGIKTGCEEYIKA